MGASLAAGRKEKKDKIIHKIPPTEKSKKKKKEFFFLITLKVFLNYFYEFCSYSSISLLIIYCEHREAREGDIIAKFHTIRVWARFIAGELIFIVPGSS